ncbi:MAG: FtsX-like permease family protein [Terriglobales bacterium]
MFRRMLWQAFARQRTRKALALAAIVAGMTVVTALLSLRVSAGDDLSRELASYGANIRIEPAADSVPLDLNGVDLRPAGAGAYLQESDLPNIKRVFWANNITAFAPEMFVPVDVSLAAAARPLGTTLEGTYFNRPVVVPGRRDPFTTGMERLEPAWSVVGRWPADDGAEALAGSRLAARLGLRPGDAVAVRTARGARQLLVTGIVSTGQGQDDALIAPLGVAQALSGQAGKMRDVLVAAVTKPEDAFARQDPSRLPPAEAERWMCSPYAVSIARELQDAIPGSVAHPLRPVAESEGVIVHKLGLLMLLITLCALAASALAIASAMSADLVERRGEIALMQALGAPQATIAGSLLAEAALLALVGGLVGFCLGEWVAARLARHVLGAAASWNPVVLPLILLLAVAVVAAGSLGALRRAARLEPAVLLRGEL